MGRRSLGGKELCECCEAGGCDGLDFFAERGGGGSGDGGPTRTLLFTLYSLSTLDIFAPTFIITALIEGLLVFSIPFFSFLVYQLLYEQVLNP